MASPQLEQVVGLIDIALSAIGVLVIAAGAAGAIIVAAIQLARGNAGPETYRTVRQGLGRAVLLGIDFLVAADIVRTVISRDLDALIVLGVLVLIRTFLSFTLETELTGHWPWDRPTRREPVA